MKSQFYKLTLVTNKNNSTEDDYFNFIKICAASGITAVQLREKNYSYQALLAFGRKLKHILDDFHIPLIINDDVNLAVELDAHGVHLGQNDGSVIAARNILGPDKIIGLSVDSIENLHIANQLPINYVGIGAIFPSNSKMDIAKIWGIPTLKQATLLSKHPTVAIGGINERNAGDVIATGCNGIAAIEAFHVTNNPEITIKNLRNIVDMKGKCSC